MTEAALEAYEDRVLSPEARHLRARTRDAEAERAHAATLLQLITIYEANLGSPDAQGAHAIAEYREEMRERRKFTKEQVDGIADLEVTKRFDVAKEECIENPTPDTFADMEEAGRRAWEYFSGLLHDLELDHIIASRFRETELADSIDVLMREIQVTVHDRYIKPYTAIGKSIQEAMQDDATGELPRE